MQEISLEEGVSAALDSLLGGRLAVLAGAGLSMPPPSSLPAAAELARVAKARHDAMYGTSRPPLAPGIEEQAQFYFDNDQLLTFYFRNLVDQHVFSGHPNNGHHAIADLLLIGAIAIAVTTNVDILIEVAGNLLHGKVGSGIERNRLAQLPNDTSPLLKIHGCISDPESMIWAPGQLNIPPFQDRISENSQWLSMRLLDKDLLIIGYWTDWDYLNQVLTNTLGAIQPANVIIVDPSASATFQQKAPNLYALGQRATTSFKHVRLSGDIFLDSLRKQFSQSFIRRILHCGRTCYVDETGAEPDARWLEPPNADNHSLWSMRRDLEGSSPNQPSKEKTPENDPLLGLTLIKLQKAGAVPDENYWNLNGNIIRVIRTPNKPLHRVEADYANETPPATSPNYVIAVGAEFLNLPSNVARAQSSGTIARGTSIRWLTRADAEVELSL